MSELDRTWSVFTKPWPDLPPDRLAGLVTRMGFDAVEFPLRPGFQVDIERLPGSLRQLAAALSDQGVRIASVASATTPEIFAACADVGVPMIRIMVPIAADDYVATRDRARRQLEEVGRLGAEYGVRVGVQPHVDFYVADSSELATLLADQDPNTIFAVWDAAHDGLAGKHPRHALRLLADRLAMVNFKNACYRPARRAGDDPGWEIAFVPGATGLCSWPEAAQTLRQLDYAGPVCLPAEYTDESDLEAKIVRDRLYLDGLLTDERSVA